MRRVAVGDIMTRNFVSVKPITNLLDCSKEMVKKRVNSLLITEGKKLLGILTARDVLWTITKKPGINLRELDALEVATKKIAVIKPSADIAQALGKMKSYGFKRLPVISKGEVVGIITLKDILRIDPNLYNQLGELLEVREAMEKSKKISEAEYETEGFCDECGSFSDLLKVEGRVLCPDCRDELY